MNVSAFGIGASDRITYDIADKHSIQARLSCSATSERMDYSLGYRYRGGSHSDPHAFDVRVGFKF